MYLLLPILCVCVWGGEVPLGSAPGLYLPLRIPAAPALFAHLQTTTLPLHCHTDCCLPWIHKLPLTAAELLL